MIVISMTSCPAKVRGDLSKWLMEINTGVYVGQVNAKVREALWKRICENIADGQATMVYSMNNEQHMEFRVHNTTWTPEDYDGLCLMKHPNPQRPVVHQSDLKCTYSNRSKQQIGKKKRKKEIFLSSDYIILDLETTGLQAENDEVIEIGAIKIIHGEIVDEFHSLTKICGNVPNQIVELTGITDALLLKEGIEIQKAIHLLYDFISDMNIIIYNASFDCAFLENICKKNQIPMMENYVLDGLGYIKKRIKGAADYKLTSVAKHLGISMSEHHRALSDCRLLYEVVLKLNEN